jgi:hypothetical protein
MRVALVAALLAACTDGRPVVQPIIDLPSAGDPGASAFPLDQLTMSIAHEGADVDIASATFTHGQTVQLSGVPFADDLVVHLTGFVGTSEVAYGRTCSFAIQQGVTAPETHLFFSREVKFASLDVMPELRSGGEAIAYHDGSGLILSGVDPANMAQPVADIERFDPRTGQLLLLATTSTPRIGDVAAALGTAADAQIALIGGLDPSTGSGATFVELIEADNPSASRIESISDGNMGRVGLTATTLSDGEVIVIGGEPPGGAPSNAVDAIALANGTAEVRQLHAMLAVPRYNHTATRLGDDVGAPVLVAGGLDGSNTPVAQAELFKPINEAFSSTFNFPMHFPRWRHKAVRMPDGSVLIIGGIDNLGNPIPTLELFTQDAGFQLLPTSPDLPATAGLVDFTATTLPDGRVLLTGGTDASGNPTNTAFIARLDPLTGEVDVVATDSLAVPRAGHQATLLCDGTVLITGGTSSPVPAERYNPPPAGRR